MDQYSYNPMKTLVDSLKSSKVVTSDKVYQAMLQVDRGLFTSKSMAYSDSPQYLGCNATISAPHMHAYALEHLASHMGPGDKVLDVGSGSGYLTVAFSKMMNDKGVVVGIEHIDKLYQMGLENITKGFSDLLKNKQIVLIKGDGREGYSECSPYNAIHVGAAAETIPDALITQLSPGGRLMIPVGPDGGSQYIYLITKSKDGKTINKERTIGVRYVPLTSAKLQMKH